MEIERERVMPKAGQREGGGEKGNNTESEKWILENRTLVRVMKWFRKTVTGLNGGESYENMFLVMLYCV